MSDTSAPAQPAEEPLVTDEAFKKAEEFIEEEEGAVSRFRGWLGHVTTTLLVVMSLFPRSRSCRRKCCARYSSVSSCCWFFFSSRSRRAFATV